MNTLHLVGFENIYGQITSQVAAEGKSAVFGVSQYQKPHIVSSFCDKVLYIAEDEGRAQEVVNALDVYGKKAVYLPAKGDVLLGKKVAALAPARINALWQVLCGKVDVLVTTADAIFDYVIPPKTLTDACFTLQSGKWADVSDVCARLVEIGYERVENPDAKGQFSLSGDVMRVFPANADNPVKIEFLYDEIDSIRTYSLGTYTTLEKLDALTLSPTAEIIIKSDDVYRIFDKIEQERRLQSRAAAQRSDEVIDALKMRAAVVRADASYVWLTPFVKEGLGTVFDYVQGFIAVMDEPKQIFEGLSHFLAEHYKRVNLLSADGEVLAVHKNAVLSEAKIMAELGKLRQVGLSSFVERISAKDGCITLNSASLPNYLKNSNMFINFVDGELKRGNAVTVYCIDAAHRKQAVGLLGANSEKVRFVDKKLAHGFICNSVKQTFVGSGDIISKASAIKVPPRSVIAPKIGDYVVHDEFGIAKCLGLVHIKNYAGEQDYMALQYAAENKIYLPVSQMDMLSVYSGSETEPKLSNPNKEDFAKEKAKTKSSIRKMALDLVELYAKRERAKGYKYQPDGEMDKQFAATFPYEETAGQNAAIAEIKEDMESGKVMDRLLCGDVGFGKTEVALRAVFKTVQAGRQVAMLAPTTILAEQHYQTIAERFAKFGIKCACLTRFCSASETKEILTGVKNGAISVIVGTHRLLSKDVEFYDVGLLVLDEEQRFGVEHKEKIKSLRTSINVLSMSATPIPRTLHMALSGIRDISVIETPPKGRKPVRTVVAEFSPDLLREAVGAELERGGQVFILYNNIARLDAFTKDVREMFPSVQIVCGHGRMPSAVLEENIHKFYSKQAQILICTTIIENGIDIPEANTLFVLEANKLGLSQMYQLKGRVGRSDRLATAYFTYPHGLLLDGDAEKRLNALMNNGDLGSGYRLAMMDLEIRGAGNVLGAEQHGHIEKVGYDMYCNLLRQTIAELSGENLPEGGGTEMVIKADAYLPQEYMPSEIARIKYYKKIAAISDEKEKDAILSEMGLEYGFPPLRVRNLAEIAFAKSLASGLGVKQVALDADCRITWQSADYAASGAVSNALSALKASVSGVQISGETLRFVPQGANVIAKLGTLISFLKAVKGDAMQLDAQ